MLWRSKCLIPHGRFRTVHDLNRHFYGISTAKCGTSWLACGLQLYSFVKTVAKSAVQSSTLFRSHSVMSTTMLPPEPKLSTYVSRRKRSASKPCSKSKCCDSCESRKAEVALIANDDPTVASTEPAKVNAVFNPMREYGYWKGLFKGTLDF